MPLIFVYGTLKKGFGNHHLLKDSEYFGKDGLMEHAMYSLGGFPGIKPGIGMITGELYFVNDKTLAALDILEGVPHLYKRETVSLISGRKADTYIYQGRINKQQFIPKGEW